MENNHEFHQSFQSLSISGTVVDFGPEFAGARKPEEIVAAINHHLNLHNNSKITAFRISFTPLDIFSHDIERWIMFAVAKGVEELDLDFSVGFDELQTLEFTNGGKPLKLPNCLFHCKSITRLSLSHSIFDPPLGFTGFDGLGSLSLAFVTITGDLIQCLVANCSLLRALSIKSCPLLEAINLSSQSLTRLVIVNCWDVYEIKICAPKLQSFIYSGQYNFGSSFNGDESSLVEAPSLVDAFISSLDAESSEPEHDYIMLISDLSHVEVLTVCGATSSRFDIYKEIDAQMLPVTMLNLRELQLLLSSICKEDLASLYVFIRLCRFPRLERLFIQLPRVPQHPSHVCYVNTIVQEPSDIVLGNLKAIKMCNFLGCETEMRLVRFLLEKANVLESLVLVTPQKVQHDSMDISAPESEADPKDWIDQLMTFPKTSAGANITVLDQSQDDKSLNPTHTEYYCNDFF